jgi:hypothetical protein
MRRGRRVLWQSVHFAADPEIAGSVEISVARRSRLPPTEPCGEVAE